MIKTRLFKKYFPFDQEKIYQIDKNDKDALISLFRRTEREIIAEGIYLTEQIPCIFPVRLLFFSVSRYVEILNGYEKEITLSDIDVMNMILYRNQFVFPISLFVKPSLPSKYILSIEKENYETST